MPAVFDDDNRNRLLGELYRREEEDLARIMAERYKIPYADLSLVSIDTDGLRLVPEDESRKARLAVFNQSGKKVRVAIAAPAREDTQAILHSLEERGYLTEKFLVSVPSLERAWGRYKDIAFASETKAGSLNIQSEAIAEFVNSVKTVQDVEKLLADTVNAKRSFRVSRIVEVLAAGAVAIDASDVHVEPEHEDVRIRYRLDGLLIDVARIDYDTFKLLLSRIKLLSGMKLNVKGVAQDGRFSIVIGKAEFEVRSSIIPGVYNETIVMRFLNPETISVSIEQLGVEPSLLEKFLREVDRPDGMVLNTGPTGSGKTTTLYAFLKRRLTVDSKIITIEDPVEYHVAGLVQTQVDRKRGYDFATGLKHALRQDPDLIMVGEIRDLETAETAIHASLTGHLVFSTIHTNNAAGAYPRLIDLGVNPKVMTSAIRLSIAQRLVRRLCKECKKPIKLEGRDLDIAKKIYADTQKPTVAWTEDVFGPVGCAKCNGTGFKGRIGIFEAIFTDGAVEAALQQNPSEREIKLAARGQGIPDMAEDGIMKMLAGITTISELERVVSLETREGKPASEPDIKEIVAAAAADLPAVEPSPLA